MLKKSGGKIRIIGGNWKRTVLPVLDVDGLRPTGDRQRETLFNWLSSRIENVSGATTLDMFSGTGALSFEAASRGFKQCTLIETNRQAAASIEANIKKLNATNMRLVRGDAFAVVPQLKEQFDVIFMDPPFALNLHEMALKCCAGKLKKYGFIYLESPQEISDEKLSEFGLEAVRRLKAGATHMVLAAKAGETE